MFHYLDEELVVSSQHNFSTSLYVSIESYSTSILNLLLTMRPDIDAPRIVERTCGRCLFADDTLNRAWLHINRHTGKDIRFPQDAAYVQSLVTFNDA